MPLPPPPQPRPAPFNVPLAVVGQMLSDVQGGISDIANADLGVFDALNAQIAICNDLRANGAFQISNADDASTVAMAVAQGTTAYEMTLPLALPNSVRVLTMSPLGQLAYGAAGATAWSSSFSGQAVGLNSFLVGNANEGRPDSTWAQIALGMDPAAKLLQIHVGDGSIYAYTGSPNAISSPVGAPGYTLPTGNTHRTLLSGDAVIYRNLFVPGVYYSLANYAFTSILNYTTGSFSSESVAMSNAPPTGVRGRAVINMNGAGPVAVDSAPAPATNANSLPTPLAGYTCFIRGADMYSLINAFPGAWLSLPWVRTSYST